MPDSNKIWNEFSYDNFGRILMEKTPYTNLLYGYNKRKVTVTDSLRSTTSWKNYDALGRIDTAYDAGGLIKYSYIVVNEDNKKRLQTTITTNGATTQIKSDLWGNRLSITEPNAGTITSTYNGFNELIKQINARGDTTSFLYDKLGRITQKRYASNNTEPLIYSYFYDNYTSTNKGRGKIEKVQKNGGSDEFYTYDNMGRLKMKARVTGPSIPAFRYSYTSAGQIDTLFYPNNFKVIYSYTSTGKLDSIRNAADNTLIYKVGYRNKFGATVLCAYGNNTATAYTYNDFGLLTRIHTGDKIPNDAITPPIGWELEFEKGAPDLFYADSSILNYRYTYTNSGLMSSRSERVDNIYEVYTCDNLDRLTKNIYTIGRQAPVTQNFSYHDNGNILSNSLVGSYDYTGNKPHAVTTITPVNQSVISADSCAVTYNFFNQPTEIKEGAYRLELSYGADRQRNKATSYRNDSIKNVRYYASKYFEYEIDYTVDSAKVGRYYYYIYGDNSVVALHVITYTGLVSDTVSFIHDVGAVLDTLRSVTESTYYIHTDHLGSYCAITNNLKQVKQRNHFDPWGKYTVKYDTIGYKRPPLIVENPALSFPITARGFTGHEHYPYFKIINMNGRLYDPTIGRFFSPDNFVQNPFSTQDFNRYSYARNNPLMYKDPTGQWYEDYDDYYDRNPIGLNEVQVILDRPSFDVFGNWWGMDVPYVDDLLTDYEVNGRIHRINDGINNLRIPVTQRQFNRLQRLFNKGENGYSNYMNKLSALNGFYTFSSGSEGFNITYHVPGGIPFSTWTQIGIWSEGMPIQTIVDGTVYVVQNSTGNYIDLTSKSLKMEFDRTFRQQPGISSIGPYFSPVADRRLLPYFIIDVGTPFWVALPLRNSIREAKAYQNNLYYENLIHYYRLYDIIK